MTPGVAIYEDFGWTQLLPLVYSRPVWELLCGADSLHGHVARLAQGEIDVWCRGMLEDAVAESDPSRLVNRPLKSETLLLNGRGLWKALPAMTAEDAAWAGFTSDGRLACVFADAELSRNLQPETFLVEERVDELLSGLPKRDVSEYVQLFDWPWQIVHANEQAIVDGWVAHGESIAGVRGRVDDGVHLLAPESIAVGERSRIYPNVVIDAEQGPVWIGENATIMPNTCIRGPVVIGDECLIQPGSVIHPGTTLGRRCKVGGEVEVSIMQGYSNKQHNGYLGHSYVGSWVNIAADCINSDLKNTYGTVRVPINGIDVDSGCQFVGMTVGDHSKAGINVSFPTGSVIGFGCNVMAPRSPKFVPSFTWVNLDEVQVYDVEKAIGVARRVMNRRQRELTPVGERLFHDIRRLATTLERSSEIAPSVRNPLS